MAVLCIPNLPEMMIMMIMIIKNNIDMAFKRPPMFRSNNWGLGFWLLASLLSTPPSSGLCSLTPEKVILAACLQVS